MGGIKIFYPAVLGARNNREKTMPKTKRVTSISLRGEWICLDMNGWRVKVPTANGQKYFGFTEYGGSSKALNAARAFHAKMEKQLERDRKEYQKTGVKPHHETLNSRNRSGHTGIAYTVNPNLDGSPLTMYIATVFINGRQYSKYFSSAQYKHKEYALEAAIAWRKEQMKKKR